MTHVSVTQITDLFVCNSEMCVQSEKHFSPAATRPSARVSGMKNEKLQFVESDVTRESRQREVSCDFELSIF